MKKGKRVGFGALVIRGNDEGGRTCSNGLPLVEPTVRMLGRFEKFKEINCDSLCKYLDYFRCSSAGNLAVVVTEYYETSLDDLVKRGRNLSTDEVTSLSKQLILGLLHLHKNHVTHGNLELSNILISTDSDDDLKVKMTCYGLSDITGHNSDARLEELLSIFAQPPEVVLGPRIKNRPPSYKGDTWALGIVLLQIYLGVRLKDIWSEFQYAKVIERCAKKAGKDSMFDILLGVILSTNPRINFTANKKIEDLLQRLLQLFPSERPSLEDLHQETILDQAKQKEIEEFDQSLLANVKTSFGFIKEALEEFMMHLVADHCWQLSILSIEEAYFLWKISGSSIETILCKNNVISIQAPIATVPSVVVEDYSMHGNEAARFCKTQKGIFKLPDNNLIEKLSTVQGKSLYISKELEKAKAENKIDENSNCLPVVVKERDVIYQARRMVQLGYLLNSLYCPQNVNELRKAVMRDVPPIHRAEVWLGLLNRMESDSCCYWQIDAIALQPTDRQLDVDIPRCHQYEQFMTTPAAHYGLRKLLKAWLLENPQYVYWQGCDSLAAPFLLLNFNRPDKALACLNEFVHRYLFNFFLKDNSAVIQEYMAVFNHLLAYTDANLYWHLKEINFAPELYSIPWFLTCFAHVLPMVTLFHAWDQVLLHDSSFPLFIGLAVMRQWRNSLIHNTFSSAIQTIKDLPASSMEFIISDSLKYYKMVPPSCTFRIHDSPWQVDQCSGLPPPFCFKRELTPLTVVELKELDCPRLSIDEFTWRVHNRCVVVIDTRPDSQFQRGSIARSKSCPVAEVPLPSEVEKAVQYGQENDLPICVVWSQSYGQGYESATKLTSLLVSVGVNGVCLLDSGYESIKDINGIIQVPRS